MTDRLMDPTLVADVLGVDVKTLKKWRWLGEGPPYVKVGRAVRYEPRALDAWIKSQTVGAA